MKCSDVKFGTSDCAYNIITPFKCGYDADFKMVNVDKCLLPEVIKLWEKGIKTTGCCCGHARVPAFIGVESEHIQQMKELGYQVAENPCRPGDEDSFVPKTDFQYGEIQKGFNWWEENGDHNAI